ncbi:coiled-coil domain-containing protein 30 isoform X2 [Sphaerodactylus townsendi]|uniref:coiled-coil domain-containing protein 30 isoform X2 n=1 Tax=Sphaerodactylus townsendi TaxID=933632 RepID=UPI002026834A|nr:coiled-coil domain-containing protein 30 isoform X2 [Sphaerodactylus townsendi]
MEAVQQGQTFVEDIKQKLKDEGIDPKASVNEQLYYVWGLFLRSQENLHFATSKLEQLTQQQVEEMREVENYVGHVRHLTEARDALAAEFEKENEQLRREFTQLQLKHESQQKEVEEMLEQEGLLEVARSSPSEQIAYLLVERSTLLEKLEGMVQKLDPPNCLEGLCAVHLQVSEQYQECQELNRLATEQKGTGERPLTSGKSLEVLCKGRILEDQLLSLEEEKRQLCMKLLESKKKTEELEEQMKGSDEEKQLLWEENAQLRKDILALQLQLTNTVKAKDKATVAENWPIKPQNHLWNTESDVRQQELSHQEVKELELDLLKRSQAIKQQGSLQEKLKQEKAKVTEAKEKILELQQKLKESDHQVRLCEAHILGQKQLEHGWKEAREKQVKAQRQFQEEQQLRKFLDQRIEDLQQQLNHSLENEKQLTRTLAKLQVQCQQLGAQLQVLEEEKKRLSNEHRHCQKCSQKLTEQLLALQKEKESFCKEYSYILQQLDSSVRKYNERHLRHKAKLRRAKETFICEMKQRDEHIRELKKETLLSKSQMEKDRLLMSQVAAENETLLQEKRELLQQLQEQEEAERNNRLVISTTQNKAQFLDEENKQLQEYTLQLRSQVGALELALRNTHSHSVEELNGAGFPERQLQSKVLPLPSISFSPMGLLDSFNLPKTIQGIRAEDAEESFSLSPLPTKSPEIGYLNVASPRDTTDCHKEEQEQPSVLITSKVTMEER